MKHPFAAVGIALSLAATSPFALAENETAQAAPDTSTVAANPHLMGDRYQQASAEVRALQLQAYHMASRRLDALLAQHQGSRQPAVVLDIDETVLDNTPYEAAGVVDGFSFPEHWEQWINAAKARLIPGAKTFLRHADARGVAIFYVSNRAAKHEAATITNLERYDLPQVSADSVRLKGPSKKKRRDAIARDHDILLLIGDTLHDFDAEFADTPLTSQRATVMRMHEAFGDRFIVLPNASYGSWTHAPLDAWQPPADNNADTSTNTSKAPADGAN